MRKGSLDFYVIANLFYVIANKCFIHKVEKIKAYLKLNLTTKFVPLNQTSFDSLSIELQLSNNRAAIGSLSRFIVRLAHDSQAGHIN